MSKTSVYFSLKDINGKHDTKILKKEIDSLSGVISLSTNEKLNKLVVDYDSTGLNSSDIKNKVEKLGYEITDVSTRNNIM